MSLVQGFSLSFNRRLHYRWEYRAFFKKSEVFRFSECTVFRIPNECGHFRLGITLKTRSNSVDRNRIKRLIRESFRRVGPKLGSYDYNVLVPAHKKVAFSFLKRLGQSLQKDLHDTFYAS